MSTFTGEPHLFVILGATGDLARRKLLPALAHARQQGCVGDPCVILGATRGVTLQTDQRFRAWAQEGLTAAGLSSGATHRWVDECFYYQRLARNPADYQILAHRIADLERRHRLPGNRIFYLALPPAAFPDAIEALGVMGLTESAGWTRLMVEKPFGHDLDSARHLNRLLHRHFDESQVYRIDHYLGKETVQNILVFRFANPIFESQWNRDRIDHVQITVAEELGVEHRAGYYDRAGALRDMVQNHLTQLLTLVAMEMPLAFEADPIRDEKLKVLRSIRPPGIEDVVFGQYQSGSIGDREVEGYGDEPGVAPDSRTETFAAVKLMIDNGRWQGVPFYLRTGKRLPRRHSQIAITFRHPPTGLFRSYGGVRSHPNGLLLTLQPDEGLSLFFDLKVPEKRLALETQSLRFQYHDAYSALPDPYETLILDVLAGDQTRFVRGDVAEAAWRLYDPLLTSARPLSGYRAGTWGPMESEALLNRDQREWRNADE
jgi:glucose-6-phosphate 1-dehydrogenase